jgi:hypothetical protein
MSLKLPPEPEPVLRRLGAYDLVEEIGRGAMGVVYRGWQSRLGREVAIKVLRDGAVPALDAIRRFRAEATAVARLNHPNIVPVFEVDECEGQHFLAMGLVSGPNLAEVTRDGPMAVRRAAEITLKVARGVQHAHEQGILHRDLKPANIVLDSRDEPHVTDFGLARQFDVESSLTLTGQVLGTPAYMAPEQARSLERIGPAVDIYSMGALLFHLVTGRAPFVGESLPELLRHVAEQEPVSPRALNPAVPLDLATVCLRCLAKDPTRRYAAADALAEDLGRFLSGRPTLARPAGWLERSRRWCVREPLAASFAATAVVLLTLVAGVSTASAAREARYRRITERAEREARERLIQSLVSVARFERISGIPGARVRALGAIRDALRQGAKAVDRPMIRDEAASCLLMNDLDLIREQSMAYPTPGFLLLREDLECFVASNGLVRLRRADGASMEFQSKPPLRLPLVSPDGDWVAVSEGWSGWRGETGSTGVNSQIANEAQAEPLFPTSVAGDLFTGLMRSNAAPRPIPGPNSASVTFRRFGSASVLGPFAGEFAQISDDSRWGFVYGGSVPEGRVIDLATGTATVIPGAVHLAACSPDGKWAALAQERGVSLWRLPSLQLERWIPEMATARPGGELCFSPDGASLAAVLVDEEVFSVLRLASIPDGVVTTPELPRDAVPKEWRSPEPPEEGGPIETARDFQWLASGDFLVGSMVGPVEFGLNAGFVRLLFANETTNSFRGLSGVQKVCIDPAERFAAVLSSSMSRPSRGLEIWDWRSRVRLAGWPEIIGEEVRWEGDSVVLRTKGRLGDIPTEHWYRPLHSAALRQHARRMAAFESLRMTEGGEEFWIWKTQEGEIHRQGTQAPTSTRLGQSPGLSYPISWSASARVGVQTAGQALRRIRIEKDATGTEVCRSDELGRRDNEHYLAFPKVTEDGRWVAAVSAPRGGLPLQDRRRWVRVLEADTGRVVMEHETRETGGLVECEFSADAEWLLVQDDGLQILELPGGTPKVRFPRFRDGAKLSRDRRWLACFGGGILTLIRTSDWTEAGRWPIPKDLRGDGAADFSRDGRWLAFTSTRHRLELLDLTTLNRLVSVELPGKPEFGPIRFGPAGRWMYLEGDEVTLSLDWEALRPALRELGLDWENQPAPGNP